MTKLPEPLPYDYVDELLDEKFSFENYPFMDRSGTKMVRFSCWPVNGSGDLESRGNYGRDMIELVEEVLFGLDEDEDGYVEVHTGFGMVWTAKAPDEEEIENLLYLMG